MKALTKCPKCNGYTEIKNFRKEEKRASTNPMYTHCDYCNSMFQVSNFWDDKNERPLAQIQVFYLEGSSPNLELKSEYRTRSEGFHEYEDDTYIYDYRPWG